MFKNILVPLDGSALVLARSRSRNVWLAPVEQEPVITDSTSMALNPRLEFRATRVRCGARSPVSPA